MRSSAQVKSPMWNQSRHFLCRHMLLHAGMSSDTGGGGYGDGGESGCGSGGGGDGGGFGIGGGAGGGGACGGGGGVGGGAVGGGGGESGAQQPSHSHPRFESVLHVIVSRSCHQRHVRPSQEWPQAGCAGGGDGGSITVGGEKNLAGQHPSHMQPCLVCRMSQDMRSSHREHEEPWHWVSQVGLGECDGLVIAVVILVAVAMTRGVKGEGTRPAETANHNASDGRKASHRNLKIKTRSKLRGTVRLAESCVFACVVLY